MNPARDFLDAWDSQQARVDREKDRRAIDAERQYQHERQQTQDQRSAQMFDAQMQNANRQQDIQEAQLKQNEQMFPMQQRAMNMQLQKSAEELKAQHRQDLIQRTMIANQAALSSGQMPEGYMDLYEADKKAGIAGVHLYSQRPEKVRAAETLTPLIKRFMKGDVSVANDKQFLDAANVMWHDQINAGVGSVDPQTGKKVVSKRLVRLLPAQGEPKAIQSDPKFYAELEVSYDDGSTKIAPMTMGRDSNPNAPVKAISAKAFLDQIVAANQFANSINPDNYAAAYNSIFKTGNSSPKEKDYNFYRSQGMSHDEALRQVSGGGSNEKIAADYADKLTSDYAHANTYAQHPPTSDQIREYRDRLYKEKLRELSGEKESPAEDSTEPSEEGAGGNTGNDIKGKDIKSIVDDYFSQANK